MAGSVAGGINRPRLRELASALDANATLEYWKSAPYFINFVEGYQLGDKLKKALTNGDVPGVHELASRTQQLDADALSAFKPVDLGNVRLRRLAGDTVERGWADLLWLPPSMPYFALCTRQALQEVKLGGSLFSRMPRRLIRQRLSNNGGRC